MSAPDKIYVEVCEDGIFAFPEPPFVESVEYIRADINKQPVEWRLEMAARHVWESWNGGTMDDVRRDMEELGAVLKERKEVVPEQPAEGLEEEISRTYHDGSVTDTNDLDHTSYENIARHFAEWGASHAKTPTP